MVNVLEQLTDVNVNDIKQLIIHINNINKNINMFVVKYEDKIIHNFGKVAHIEDVNIDNKFWGNGLAKNLINKLISVSKKHNCYKIILNALDNVKPFYEKLGFIHHTNSMHIVLLWFLLFSFFIFVAKFLKYFFLFRCKIFWMCRISTI